MKKLFKNKLFIILLIVVLSLILCFIGIYFLFYFSFNIKGSKTLSLNVNSEYKEKGVKFNYLKQKVNVKNNINIKKIGSYKVTYSIKYLFFNIKKERVVNVVDKEKPVIELVGNIDSIVCPNNDYIEEGYKAYDNYDGDITSKVKTIIGDGIIDYIVLDSSLNQTKITRNIIKKDETKPVITLKGNDTVYIKKGVSYQDLGYEVTDNCDTNIEVQTNSFVDSNKEGKYKVIYTATDSSGNKEEVIRNVVVYSSSGTGVIYLTFDDGPSSSGTTAHILDVLRDEGVSATFFVTGSGPDYLIKREYDEGHTVALHTSTHEYSSIYSSVDNYFNDLSIIQNRVYNITGEKVNIIRFPGGSNNTVSNNYNNGIMNTLTNEVINRGYNYFDWNVSSGDAGGCSTSTCVYNNVINGLSKSRQNIVLMHDIKSITSSAIQDIIRYGKENGYVFKKIDQTTTPIRFK
ncbi:MAG: polysaccharide deacetylase [bacterium]|nr:polysaccharide deacetylase [bacterium]